MSTSTSRRRGCALGGRMLVCVLAALCASVGIGSPVAAQCVPRWLPAPVRGSVLNDGSVASSVTWDPDGPGPQPELMVVGGAFSNVAGVLMRNVAAWDGVSWRPMGAGIPDPVGVLAVLDGRLYAGANGGNAVLAWSGTAWEPLPGMAGNTLALTMHEGKLIAGGSFDTPPRSRVIAWDGTSWTRLLGPSTVGSGAVQAFAVYRGTLYAGGSMVDLGCIIAYDGAAWKSVGGGVSRPSFPTSAAVRDLEVFHDELIAIGSFTQTGPLGGVPANNLAAWNGSSWRQFGPGFPGPSDDLMVWNDQLWAAGGLFFGVSPTIGFWDGAQWQRVGLVSGMGGPGGAVGSMSVFQDHLIVNGTFTQADGVPAQNIVRRGPSGWEPLTVTRPRFVAAGTFRDKFVYMGGTFVETGIAGSSWLASWSDATWSFEPDRVNGPVDAVLASRPLGTDGLVFGGRFRTLYVADCNGVAVLDQTGWKNLRGGVSLGTSGSIGTEVSALANFGGQLVIGGNFDRAGGWPASNVARWTGSDWAALGNGTNGPVRALTEFEGQLVAGGSFTAAGQQAASRVARWTGSFWQPLGAGLDGNVAALATHAGSLYAGGSFSTGGGMARWTGSAWAGVGGGVDGSVAALLSDGTRLYVGGRFTRAGAAAAPGIAMWDGSAWSGVGTGLSGGEASALGFTLVGSELVVVGSFDACDGVPAAGVARLTTDGRPRFIAEPAASTVAEGGTVTFSAVPASGFSAAFGWTRDGQPVVDGPGGASPGGGTVSGALTPVLRIVGVRLSDAGVYKVSMTTECGSVTTGGASLKPGCRADCNRDGKMDIQDFTCFQGKFALGDTYADVGGPAGCDPDGALGIMDFICFQNLFASCSAL